MTTWRAQRERGELLGLTPKRRGPAPKAQNPLAPKVAAPEREVTRYNVQAEQAETMAKRQKKLS